MSRVRFLHALVFFSIVMFLAGMIQFTPVAKAETETINLKISSWNPPHIGVSLVEKEWAKKIEERSGGRVKFTFYWGASLAKPMDTYRAAQSGVADITYYVIGFNPGFHKLNHIMSLPFFGWNSMETHTKVYHALRKKFPEMDAEFKGLTQLWAASMPAFQIHFLKKEGRLPEDVKGMRLLAGSSTKEITSSVGIVPVVMGPPDWYMALERGVAEGHILHWPAVYAFKTLELFETHSDFGPGGMLMQLHGMWINNDVWNKIPADVQKIILDLSDWVQNGHIEADTQIIKLGMAQAKKLNHKIVLITPDEKERWVRAVSATHEEWIEQMEKDGLPGRAMYNEAKKLVQIYQN